MTRWNLTNALWRGALPSHHATLIRDPLTQPNLHAGTASPGRRRCAFLMWIGHEGTNESGRMRRGVTGVRRCGPDPSTLTPSHPDPCTLMSSHPAPRSPPVLLWLR